MLEIVRLILRNPVHVPEPLAPCLLILRPAPTESLELCLCPLLLSAGLLFFARSLEPLREVRRVTTFKPRRPWVLRVVANNFLGVV